MSLHWILQCTVCLLSVIVTFVADVLRFNLDTELANAILEHSVVVAALALMAYGTFSLSTRLRTSRKLVISSQLAILPVVFSMVTPMLAEEHETRTSAAFVNRVNQHPALFFRTPVSLEAHTRNTDELFAQLDAEVGVDKFSEPESVDLDDSTDGTLKITVLDTPD